MVKRWIDKKLGEIGEIRMCKRIFANQTTTNGDIPFYKIGTFGKEPDAYISCALYEEYKNKYSFPLRGDILLSAAGTLGRTVVYDGKPAYFQDSNIVWLEINKDQICNEYLNHCYQVMEWASSEGSTISRLYNSIIRDTEIKLPPLREQRAIAAALSDADAYISSIEKLIAKKSSIKQGAMQELLTGKRRLPGFDGEWVEKRVGDIGYDYSGLSGKRKENFGVGNARYITFLNVLLNTVIDTTNLESVEVSESEKQNAVQCGDLFFNTSSETPDEVGMCAVLNKPLNNTYLNSFCFGFRLTDDDIDGLYLSYFFNSNEGRKIMTLLAQGAIRYNLSKAYFNEIVLQLPRKSEQTAIATVLSDMNAEIDVLLSKLEKARCIKQGMMSELLKGRIRLVEEETDNGEN